MEGVEEFLHLAQPVLHPGFPAGGEGSAQVGEDAAVLPVAIRRDFRRLDVRFPDSRRRAARRS